MLLKLTKDSPEVLDKESVTHIRHRLTPPWGSGFQQSSPVSSIHHMLYLSGPSKDYCRKSQGSIDSHQEKRSLSRERWWIPNYMHMGMAKCIALHPIGDTNSLAVHTAYLLNTGEARHEIRVWKETQGADLAVITVFSPGWHGSHSSRHTIFSPLIAGPTDTAVTQQ